MKIVVDVPDEEYESYALAITFGMGSTAIKRILNGTPLPKGHGALIDKKDIDANCITYHTDYDGSWCYRVSDIENNVPTIIEADKEGAEE